MFYGQIWIPRLTMNFGIGLRSSYYGATRSLATLRRARQRNARLQQRRCVRHLSNRMAKATIETFRNLHALCSTRVKKRTLYQIEWNGGAHWATYIPATGAFYHSWYGLFGLQKGGFIAPGKLTPTKCNLLEACLQDRNKTVGSEGATIGSEYTTVCWLAQEDTADDPLAIARANVERWQAKQRKSK